MASPFSFLRSGPPPPKVALLPSALFFTRTVAVTPGAAPAEAAAQIELALEAVAPFPLAQLYYGWFWPAGAEQAFVYAAYRRRFTAEQTAAWDGAEVVLPEFAAAFGAQLDPAAALVFHAPDALTAVLRGSAGLPSRIVSAALAPEATDADRAAARDGLLRDLGGSKSVVDLTAPLAPGPAESDREIEFRSGDFVSRLPAAVLAALDVRDKGELAALRNARRRDVVLWRTAVGLAASLVLLGLGELALVGGRMWQQSRNRQVAAQKAEVDRISGIHELTGKIEELATKRLRPVEMLMQLVGENYDRKPDEIWFTRVQSDTTRGLYSIFVEGVAANAALVNSYEATLRKVPQIEKADIQISGSIGQQAKFLLTAVFKPDAFPPVAAPAVEATAAAPEKAPAPAPAAAPEAPKKSPAPRT
jgi:hypothetical protein